MSDARCAVTELRTGECEHCRDRARRLLGNLVAGAKAPRRVVDYAPARSSFPAAYPGHCETCTGRILVGDLISRGDSGWVHEECAP